jgi:uncharacterized membrane protein (DUF2068 family)
MPEQPETIAMPRPGMSSFGRWLRLIGLLKLAEGALVLGVAIGVLKLLHHDVAATIADWVAAIKIHPLQQLIDQFLAKTGPIDDHRLKELSAGSFVYGAVRIVEGVGLLARLRWAEYLVVIATSLFIPLEIHELLRRATVPKAIVLALNLMIVLYLVAVLDRSKRRQRQSP